MPAALARALRRAAHRWGGRRGLSGLHAQRGQPFLLLGQELRPGARVLLPVQPLAQVVALEQHARLDDREDTAGVDHVRQDAVVPLPAQRPRAVPVRVDRRQLRLAYGGSLRVLAQAVFFAPFRRRFAMCCPTGTTASPSPQTASWRGARCPVARR